ncbi:MAG TPA: hypothetical protein VM577_14805 [Anaerovoracaceae bacterium]|nr:hypothetical protein [Anaerovoracaceae bacterium]
MKKFLLVGLLGLSACVAQAEPTAQQDDNDYQNSSGIYLDQPSIGHEPACAAYEQRIYLPNGGYTVVLIPALCNPLDIDKGDPPPEEQDEEMINPDPNEAIELPAREMNAIQ